MSGDTELLRTVALEADTGRITGVVAGGGGEHAIAISIACHPDVRRWGERTWLTHPLVIDRRNPSFDDGAGTGQLWPLADASVSRSPVVEVRPWGQGGVEVRRRHDRASLFINGSPLVDIARLDEAEVGQGALLELSHRVAVWIQRERIPGREPRVAPEIVGRSAGILRAREDIAKVAPYDFTVLVRGETGSGKELVARAIHDESDRAHGPLLDVNLGSVAPDLVAAELFGHTKGAFSGATSARRGWFRAADTGTLFLDEIGEASAEVQRALLRVLETGRVQPVGSDTDVAVDVRVVAATDADLEADIDAGRFRNPLLQRLSQYVINIPPLRERRGDIPLLVRHTLLARAVEFDIHDRVVPTNSDASAWIDTAAMRTLIQHDWPGNVRELINVVTRTAIRCRTDARFVPTIETRRRARVAVDTVDAPVVSKASTDHGSDRSSLPARRKRLTDIELGDLETALQRNDWRPGPAARELGIARSSIYELIRRNPTIPESTTLELEEIRAALDACNGDVRAAARRLRVPVRGLKIRMSQLDM